MSSLYVVDGKTAWTGGCAGVYVTFDRGLSWRRAALETIRREPVARLALWSSGTVLFASASAALVRTDTGIVSVTFDGRLQREQNFPNAAPSRFGPMRFVDQNNGWTCDASRVGVSSDGGATWHDREIAGSCASVVAVSPDEAWFLLGKGGLRTLDRGVSWTPITAPVLQNEITNLRHTRSGEMWLCGTGGRCYRSTDAATWRPVNLPESVRWPGPVFSSQKEGWAIGLEQNPRAKVVLHTCDGGVSWRVVHRGISDYISDFDSVEDGQAWFMDWHGTITLVEDHGRTVREATVVRKGILGGLLRRLFGNRLE